MREEEKYTHTFILPSVKPGLKCGSVYRSLNRNIKEAQLLFGRLWPMAVKLVTALCGVFPLNFTTARP